MPCAWLEQAASPTCQALSQALPSELIGFCQGTYDLRPLPAPDRIWAALSRLAVPHSQGCVVISGEPLLLQAGLKAGLWTIGLALYSPPCEQAAVKWSNLPAAVREQQRRQATLNLYRLGVHSVIDQLTDAPSCLAELNQRRSKGEKP